MTIQFSTSTTKVSAQLFLLYPSTLSLLITEKERTCCTIHNNVTYMCTYVSMYFSYQFTQVRHTSSTPLLHTHTLSLSLLTRLFSWYASLGKIVKGRVPALFRYHRGRKSVRINTWQTYFDTKGGARRFFLGGGGGFRGRW